MIFLSDDYIPNLSYDSLIFGFSGEKAKDSDFWSTIIRHFCTSWWLHPKRRGFWIMLGNGDSPERTGNDQILLEQFSYVCARHSPNPEWWAEFLKQGNCPERSLGFGRFISVGILPWCLWDGKRQTWRLNLILSGCTNFDSLRYYCKESQSDWEKSLDIFR